MKILYVASEAFPLIKTGGLGDVAGSLPPALQALGHEVWLIMPAYQETLARAGSLEAVGGLGLYGGYATLLRGELPNCGVKLLLVDAPDLFARPGNPYLAPDGKPWYDNAQRFALFARAVVALAQNRLGLGWRPDIVHCNDWQSALVPALLSLEPDRPATVFTIHNLAYQGLFPHESFIQLGLPETLWSYDALEFHGKLSFIKGGLVFADTITTVSPTYAREIQTPEFGAGLDGLLRWRSKDIHGILNGIDECEWNPATDPNLVQRYGIGTLDRKRFNKEALQRRMGLPPVPDRPLIGMVGRLVEQKGVDLLLEAMPRITTLPLQLALLGSGTARFEKALKAWAAHDPQRIAVHIGYNEGLAHLVEGGADIFLMPSRFEPCGLNQMYSLRYGTLPVVRRTGGLADTVVDATSTNLASGTASGVVFPDPEAEDLLGALHRIVALFRKPPLWRQMQRTGMKQDFSWGRSAKAYADLYALTMNKRAGK